MIDERQIDDLKRGLTSYVLRITQPDRRAGHNMYKCPLCGSGNKGGRDSNGAFSIKDGVAWHCFSCGKGGDIFTLIKEHEGIEDFTAQAERAAEVAGVSLEKTTAQPVKKDPVKPEPKPIIKGKYKSYVEKCRAAAGKTDYFKSRGFNDDIVARFALGYDESKKAIVIPYDRDGSYYITRSTEGKSFRKPYGDDAGVEPVYNKAALYDTKPCFVCESPIDAISIIAAGGGACSAVALGGTGHRKLIEAVEAKAPSCMLVLSLDHDDAGAQATEKAAEELKQLNIPFITASYSYDLYPEESRKDANDYYRTDAEQLKKDIAATVEAVERAANAEKEAQLERINSYTAFSRLADFLGGIKDAANTSYIPTGFADLDEELDGGLYPGLYILGAISSLGKTTLLLQIADQIAAAGHEVLYFSLEMAASELISKSISRYTYKLCNGSQRDAKTARGITTASRYANYSQREKDLIKAATDAYAEHAKSLYIYEGVGDIGITQVKSIVEEHKQLTGKTPLVFIDYLQILAPYDMRASDKQNTDKAVLELKRLARDYKTPVIGISSFNRDNYSTEVNMSAFKESGAIEYGSDVLLALQPQGMKPGYTASEQKENVKLVKDCKASSERKVEAVILKNRNGKTGGKVGFTYHSLFNCFEKDDGFIPLPDDYEDLPFND